MDIAEVMRTVEARRRAVEAKIGLQNGQLIEQQDVTPASNSAADSSAGADVKLDPVTMEKIEKLAQQVWREGSPCEDRYRGDYSSLGQAYEFLLHVDSPEYRSYQERLAQLRMTPRKRPHDSDGSREISRPTEIQPKRRASRWGEAPSPAAQVPAAPPMPMMTEDHLSALQLIELRQKLAAKDMALTAKAGVLELQLGMGIPSAEHRMRALEMEKTKEQAKLQTKPLREGKHHMQDFLPKAELEKFLKPPAAGMPSSSATQYEEHKLTESNIGYKMLKNKGWTEGKGLGSLGTGIAAPVSNVGAVERAGLGTKKPDEPSADDDEFSLYRKRMMTAYKYRPNPLNNPRRPYY